MDVAALKAMAENAPPVPTIASYRWLNLNGRWDWFSFGPNRGLGPDHLICWVAHGLRLGVAIRFTDNTLVIVKRRAT